MDWDAAVGSAETAAGVCHLWILPHGWLRVHFHSKSLPCKVLAILVLLAEPSRALIVFAKPSGSMTLRLLLVLQVLRQAVTSTCQPRL